ncbi:hypothetical protein L917_14120, partial [Phytophthora nicotianae]
NTSRSTTKDTCSQGAHQRRLRNASSRGETAQSLARAYERFMNFASDFRWRRLCASTGSWFWRGNNSFEVIAVAPYRGHLTARDLKPFSRRFNTASLHFVAG